VAYSNAAGNEEYSSVRAICLLIRTGYFIWFIFGVFCGIWKKIDRTGEEKESSFAETVGKFAEVQLQCA